MKTRPRRRPLGAPLLLALAAALGACASSKEFAQPAPPPRANIAEQIKAAEELAARAQAAERDKKPDEAIELYKKAVATYRDFPGVWYNMGLLLLDKGDALAAVDAFRAAGDIEPRDPRPPYAIGVIYEKQRWNQEAQRHYADALARDANYLPALERSIYLDMIENTFTPVTLERTRRALLSETDEKWRAYFERTQLHLNAALNQTTPEAGALTAPESDMDRRP
jgi:tetratricopeptide (TPR) repeat protein